MSQPSVIVADLVGFFIDLVVTFLVEWIFGRKRERK
jgi:hypothetical protein